MSHRNTVAASPARAALIRVNVNAWLDRTVVWAHSRRGGRHPYYIATS